MAQQLDSWIAVAEAIGPFLNSPDPFAALSKAGYTFGGDVAERLRTAPKPFYSAEDFARLVAQHGAAPKFRLHVGRKAAAAPLALQPGQSQVRASIDMDPLNQALAALYQFEVVPHRFDSGELAAFHLQFADFKNLCGRVPDGAKDFDGLEIAAPPQFSAGQTPTSVHVSLPIRLVVNDPAKTAFVCTLEVEIPLVLTVSPSIWFDPIAIQGLGLDVEVAATSPIVPKSTAAKGQLGAIFKTALITASPLVGGEANFSPLQGGVALSQFTAITRHGGKGGFAVAGTGVTSPLDATSTALLNEPVPATGFNFHLAADQSFATALLNAAVDNGSLAKLIGKNMGSSATLTIGHGTVSFDAGQVIIRLPVTASGGCPKDLSMLVTISGNVGVFAGGLTLPDPTVDIDLDDVDAVICALIGFAAVFPMGLLVTSYALLTLNAHLAGQAVPAYSSYLGGSEQDFNLRLTQATTDTHGTLLAGGTASVDGDSTQSFIYLKVVTGAIPALAAPVEGVTVELLELDNPAPAGDDVQIKLAPLQTYVPSGDQFLGRAVTNKNGQVRFVVTPNTVAGTLTQFRNSEDPQTGKLVKVVVYRQVIGEGKPDFGINVIGADGSMIVRRRLIALNVANKHVGSFAKPFIVNIGGTVVTTH